MVDLSSSLTVRHHQRVFSVIHAKSRNPDLLAFGNGGTEAKKTSLGGWSCKLTSLASHHSSGLWKKELCLTTGGYLTYLDMWMKWDDAIWVAAKKSSVAWWCHCRDFCDPYWMGILIQDVMNYFRLHRVVEKWPTGNWGNMVQPRHLEWRWKHVETTKQVTICSTSGND